MNVYITTGDITDMQGPCPNGFHVPTKDEANGLVTIMTSLGLNSPTNFSINLKVPLTGKIDPYKSGGIGVSNRGVQTSLYASTKATNGALETISAHTSNSSIGFSIGGGEQFGWNIRPFKDEFVTPVSGWTVINGTIGGAGIFWNQADGIISITSNGTTGYSISDKNCGATTVYNYGDTMTEANCGYYYQRGNNYGFPFSGSVTTSSTQVNAQNYGPGNYYNSSTFITANPRDSSANKNLRGGETGVVTKSQEVKNIYLGDGKITVASDMKGPCEDGFHVPLNSEWTGLKTIMDGLGLTSGSYRKIYLHMPFAGWRNESASLTLQGSSGLYFSSTQYSGYSDRAYRVNFDSSGIVIGGALKCYGCPIRPFKDEFVVPTSGWTAISGTIGGAGIFWNQTDGIISITSNGTTGYTISDKNLGATTVYNDGNTLTQANMGNMYQRGNNYGFPSTGSISKTSTTKVNASTYGPGNYYSSDTFIKPSGSYDWSSSTNSNLWGGETQGTYVEKVEPGIKEVYIGTTKVYPKQQPRTFTITWTETSDPTQFNPTYSDDAAGLTAGSTDFDEFFGYYGVRLSNAGVETATVKQSSPGILDITQLGTLTSGDNVMIAFPRRGIKMSKSGNKVTLSITEEPNKDGYQYYAHTKGSDAKNTLYLGAYKMTSGYTSLSGKSPLAYKTRDGFRSGVKSTYDSSAGTNRYSQISIYARWYINALYMMKYGNPDSQSVIGKGSIGSNPAKNTGGTNSQTSASYGTSSTSTQVKLFGLEDWWGNIFEYLDCCWFNSSTQLTVDKTNSVFQDYDYSTNLGTASGGWLAGIDGSNDGMFRNVNNSGGSSTTYYTDVSDSNASRVLYAGTNTSSGDYSGAFQVSYTSTSYDRAICGARLMYI